MTLPISALKGQYPGQTAWIIGRGSSVEHLRKEHFTAPGPVIALSQTLAKVESLDLNMVNPVFSMQKDMHTITPQKPNAGLIVHQHESAGVLLGHRPRYVFDNPADFFLPVGTISAITALHIAYYMGCENIVFVSFDGYTHGDNRSWIPEGAFLDESLIVEDMHMYVRQAWGMNQYLGEKGYVVKWLTPIPELPKNKVKLKIATPFYNLQGFSPYFASLLKMAHLFYGIEGMDFNPETDFWNHEGDSYVSRARNSLIAKFMQSDGTDLLFIDSDEEWVFTDEQAIVNIIASPYEVTAAAYPLKNKWEQYGIVLDTQEDGNPIVCETTGMLRATRAPGGFLRIKRSCIEKMENAYPETQYLDDSTGRLLLCHNLFECPIHKRRRWGEDYAFCKKWEDIGGKIWVEPRMTFGHFGIHAWYGNYQNLLTKQTK